MQGRTEGRSWAERATLNYASRNWDDQKGKFEFRIRGYKERNPAKEKEGRQGSRTIAFIL